MLYQVFCLVVTNENGTILMNLLGGYFSTNNSNLSKKIELTFYWLDIYWLSSSSKYTDCQRWSRGHKARGQGQGQGHKKNPRPRPRTAFSRTEPLEAKDRNDRGQGQGPRTQAQMFSEKKVFKNFFQAISNSLA